MTEPFIGEVQMFAFPFAPLNWSFANGSLLTIRQSSTLFALFGTSFGGDGVTTFGLPNLASRGACGAGQSPGNSQRTIGQTFGSPSVTLNISQMPNHNHLLYAYTTEEESQVVPVPTSATALGNVVDGSINPFAAAGSSATIMNANTIGMQGGGNGHENRQPFLGLNYSVALFGTYPYFG